MDVASENHGGNANAVKHLWFEAALISGQWERDVRLTVSGGMIAGIERGLAWQTGDARSSVGIPGLPNLHSHAFQRGMAGLAESRGPAADSFWTWREIMYHFLDRLTPDDMEAVAALAYVEMLESGFTRVGEFHYVHHDCDGLPYANVAELSERICGAAHDTGINLTLLPSFYAHSNFGELRPTTGQRRFITSLDQFAQLYERARRTALALPGATVGVAPHSLRAVTPEELGHLVSIGGDGPFHIHAAEQVKEVEDCLAATGARPVEWLLANVPLDHRWCLIHATHLTPDETERLAKSGATVGLCPITEANLGDGIFPAVSFASQGGQMGIGTDSNVSISAPEELRTLEYVQRLVSRSRNVLARQSNSSTGRSLFNVALTGGNRALDIKMGEIAIGNPADIVTLTCDHGTLTERERGDTVLDQFIFGGRCGHVVDSVWVRGKRWVENGRHVQRDGIFARFRRSLKRLLSD